jgi:hypothetical protein
VFRRLAVIAIILASGVALSRFVDLGSFAASILSLSPETVLRLFLLLLCSELIKGLRWAYFLRAADLDIRTVDGVTCYLGGQAATALPGGSLLSMRLAEEHGEVRMYQAASGVVGLNIADMFALSAVCAIGIVLTHEHMIQFALPLLVSGLAFGAVLVIRSRGLAGWLSRQLNRCRLTRRFAPQEDDFRQHVSLLMRRRVLLVGIGFSLLTTMIAIAILMTLVNGLTDRGISISEALYVHSFSGETSKIFPASGSFGVTDASLAGLLNFIGIGFARATFIALASHTMGLIFRTTLGVVVLLARYPSVLIGQLPVRRRAPQAAVPATPLLPVSAPAPAMAEVVSASLPAAAETPSD